MSGTPFYGIVTFLAGSLWLALNGEATFCVASVPTLCALMFFGSDGT